MADESLVKYIRETLEYVESETVLRSLLTKQGWSKSDIDEALEEVRKEKPHHPKHKKQHKDYFKKNKLLGARIIGALGIISSVMLIIGGFANLFFVPDLGLYIKDILSRGTDSILDDFSVNIYLLSWMSIAVGMIGIGIYYLILKMKKIGCILAIAINLFLLVFVYKLDNFIGIAISLFILIYMFLKRKLFF